MLPMSFLLLHSASIMIFLAGEARLPAARALTALAPVLPLVVVGTSYSTALILGRRYRHWAWICFSGFLINGALNFMWIPEHGASGAAWATVATEFWVAMVLVVLVRREARAESPWAGVGSGALIRKTLAPSVIMCLGSVMAWLLPPSPALGAVLVLALLTSAHHLFRGAGAMIRRELEAPHAVGEREGF